jgi:hypothetical protein
MNSENYSKLSRLPSLKSSRSEIRNSKSGLSSSAPSQLSYIPFVHSKNVHLHDHRPTPHIHSYGCERFTSGKDQNRNFRFYFTKNLTPVRVYINYASNNNNNNDDNFLLLPSISEEYRQVKDSLNGRKLSSKVLTNQLKLAPEFVQDASSLIFLKDSLSFVPSSLLDTATMNVATRKRLTLAEMALMPSGPQNNKTKNSSRKNSIFTSRSL